MNKAMEQINIADIAKKLESGDKSAFESFYRYKCDNAIAYLIYAFGIDENDAYDITAAAFEVLPERIRYFRGGDFEKWFNTLLNNSARNYIKKESRSFPVDMKAMEQYLTREAFDSGDKKGLEHRETIKRLNQIIDALPAKQREAVILHYFGGLTVSQASMRMNVKPETVKEHLARARKTISKKVKQEGDVTHWLGGFIVFPPFLRKTMEAFADIFSYPALLPADTKTIIATTAVIMVIGSGIPADLSHSRPVAATQIPAFEEQADVPEHTAGSRVRIPIQMRTTGEEIPDAGKDSSTDIINESAQKKPREGLSSHSTENAPAFDVSGVAKTDTAISAETKEPEIISLDNNHPEIICGIDEYTPPLYGESEQKSDDTSSHVPPNITIELSPPITPKEFPVLRDSSDLKDADASISRDGQLQTLPELKSSDMLISREGQIQSLPEPEVGDWSISMDGQIQTLPEPEAGDWSISRDLSQNNISEETQEENDSNAVIDLLSKGVPLESGNRLQADDSESDADENAKSYADAGFDTVEPCDNESGMQKQQAENDVNTADEAGETEQ